jgi:hypothetical protein
MLMMHKLTIPLYALPCNRLPECVLVVQGSDFLMETVSAAREKQLARQ